MEARQIFQRKIFHTIWRQQDLNLKKLSFLELEILSFVSSCCQCFPILKVPLGFAFIAVYSDIILMRLDTTKQIIELYEN